MARVSSSGLWWPILFVALWASGVQAQGLIVVPKTVTRELGAYYLSKIGLAEGGFNHYATLYQRNINGNNVYNKINDIGENESPRDAAAKISNVRAVYSTHTVGGKVTVESFYRLLRCEDDSCFGVSRVVASSYLPGGGNGPIHLLTPVKTTMGNTQWEVNAPQAVVNKLLTTGQGEQAYKDEVYKTQMFYKVSTPPPPCSSANPLTLVGSLSEYFGLPGWFCITVNGTTLMVGTQQPELTYRVQHNIYSPALPSACDGSLGLLYTLSSTAGPEIYRVVRTGGVPFTIELQLPPFNSQCLNLYQNPDLTMQAAAALLNARVSLTRGAINPNTVPQLAALGFSGNCAPTFFYGSYGFPVQGQNEALTEGVDNKAFTNAFIPYGDSPCISALGQNTPDYKGPRTYTENSCAQYWFGNATQLQEGIITFEGINPDTSSSIANTYRTSLESECNGTRYNIPMTLVLPQIAVDFEAEKNFLLSSTEVKLHLDSVAANAASVLAVEAALATSGIVVARIIARSGIFRRRRVPSSAARAFALLATAVVITVFNIPNFALINKSLSNHGKVTAFTEASINNYRPSNFTALLRSETHSFVEVKGSSATAVIGLLLYCATLIFCLYLTWSEFTEIILRREAAESRLGQEALIRDKDLLVQWRGTDSLVYDTLHPKKVVESAQAAELEFMRRNLAYSNSAQSNGGVIPSPRSGVAQPPPGGFAQLRQNSRPGEGTDLYDTPDLYSEL